MTGKVSVSVIIPVYNSEKYLAETIQSLKNQYFTDWECVLINDGSSDKSEIVALQNIQGDKRFRYIYQENTGVCIARNNAIRSSFGEYILCLDSDDLISENFLGETVKILKSNPNIKIVTSIVNYIGKVKGTLNVISYDIATILEANQIVVTSLFRRLDFDKVGGFNTNMKEGLEDWDFWISILKNGGEVRCANNAKFYYRILRKSRNTEVNGETIAKLRFQIWQNHKELYCKYFINPVNCFEYTALKQSPEYKLGYLLLKPIRYVIQKIRFIA